MPCVKYDDNETPTIISDDESSKESEDQYVNCNFYYPTKLARKIVNAASGETYPYIQGSYDSLRLYMFIDMRGCYDESGCKLTRFDPVNRTPNFLYYDSPEQCAQHLQIKMKSSRIKKWHNERSRLFDINGSFIREEWEKIKKDSYGRMNGLVI